MKSSAHIVNTACGGMIDENALAAVLRDGRLAGAALDVFATEPPGASPLLKLPNVVATPHLGAGTSDAKFRAGEEASRKVLAELEAVFTHGHAGPGARTSSALRATHSPTLTCTAQSQADRRAE